MTDAFETGTHPVRETGQKFQGRDLRGWSRHVSSVAVRLQDAGWQVVPSTSRRAAVEWSIAGKLA